MKKFFFILLLPFCLFSVENTSAKIHTLYTSLNPLSISEHLAFYKLYPEHPDGAKALNDAWNLLSKNSSSLKSKSFNDLPNTMEVIVAIVSLINKEPNEETPILSNESLNFINELSAHLANRRLKGYKAISENDVIGLEYTEIDLARGLFLSQFGNDEESLKKIESYEALIDLMALQILSSLPKNATHEQILHQINHFIFNEMCFRFPPHSLYAKDIDIYTFLPSVLDSRRGVCLGVSILYLCLAQRLDLPLEMITPPGHIYVRYNDGKNIINIETTARGMHIESEEYLSIDTRSLEQRNIKEVIGFAHVNQASTYLHEGSYENSLASYKKAAPYLENDMLLKELTGFNYIFLNKVENALPLLNEVKDHLPDHSVSKDTMAEDYLAGDADSACLQAIFMRVDETRESVLKKRQVLEDNIKKFPRFRAGLCCLASTYLQLHQVATALELLEKAYTIDPQDPTTNYYLAALYVERMDYKKAWTHLHNTEKIVKDRNHHPKALKVLRKELEALFPE